MNIDDITAYVISVRETCYYNPWKMLPAAEIGLETFMPQDAHETCNGRSGFPGIFPEDYLW